ncbi:putative calmin-like [Scophthalmus maximus]|uniref:Calmin n=1 Tax=Scophthalmus maximus TaxID=52904 RepID=A0A2U9CU99_SCOMX|nr:putative calmin-like [Scophthalmus maximus]
MQDKANRGSRKESFGEISDRHMRQPQGERNAVQKRTFARWMNVVLQRCDPPLEVHDLFIDIQDGRILMALLEELTGCKLLYRFRSSSHRIFRLNNISKALAFLDDRHVKLLGIDASGIADGVPSVVLNLVWIIVLHFQPNDIGSYSHNTLPSKGRKAAREPKYHGKAIKTLLQWVQRCTSTFGVEVHDFGKSWRSGLAFLAMIKSINPDLVDLRESLSREPREIMQQAFTVAHHSLDIIPLLEPEDVTCTSPDEQSVITYVSMFLGHCSDIEEDHTTYIEVPEIPHFGSLESVSSGETLADNAEAQAMLGGLAKSSEQLLWKRWSRTSSGSAGATSHHTNEAAASDGDISSSRRRQSITEQSAGGVATSPFNKKRGRRRSNLQPPSPLDAGIVSPEIRSWMEKGTDRLYSKPRVDESHLSLSSEEGIYSLSVLDSDEEDAYSYILDLNKEVFQPYNQPKRQVPRVEEETVEEMNGESKHQESCQMLNGCSLQEGPVVQRTDVDLESEVRAQSGVPREFGVDKNGTSFREVTSNRPVFDKEPEDESSRKENPEEGGVVRGQINDYSDYGEEETENVRLVTHGYDEAEALIDEAQIFKMAGRQKEVEEDTDEGISVKWVQVSEKRVSDEEDEENTTTFEVGRDRKLGTGKGEEAASCDITPLELEMLLVLWILLYCCFILPQMNL